MNTAQHFAPEVLPASCQTCHTMPTSTQSAGAASAVSFRACASVRGPTATLYQSTRETAMRSMQQSGRKDHNMEPSVATDHGVLSVWSHCAVSRPTILAAEGWMVGSPVRSGGKPKVSHSSNSTLPSSRSFPSETGKGISSFVLWLLHSTSGAQLSTHSKSEFLDRYWQLTESCCLASQMAHCLDSTQ
jgi:hypothetical protein